MAGAMPLTVLMTVRNGEPYLEDAVRSILKQTYRDFNFLVLDNASVDRSPEIIRDFGDPRIELVELKRDLGQTGALNRGLERADTPYIARIDADDISHPLRLERQMEFLHEHPEVGLVGTWYELIDPDGSLITKRRLPVAHDELLKAMLFENQFAHSAATYRREVALACGGYEAKMSFAQDYALWWQVGLSSHLANLPEFLVQIRIHPEQMTQKFKEEVAEEPFNVTKRALGDPRLPEEARALSRRACAYADLKYAAAVSGRGKVLLLCVRIVRGLLNAPSLLNDGVARGYLVYALLGHRGFALWKRGLGILR